jgi:hypothetical protein
LITQTRTRALWSTYLTRDPAPLTNPSTLPFIVINQPTAALSTGDTMDYYRQNELPETVKRYKTYTDAFQEWLMKTAIQRGVENAAQIAEQAKKKKKKGKKTYKISTEQQAILVDGIADTKGPLVDTSGLRDLQDAIRSRKEVTQFHKLSQSADTGHSFFNSVLENAHSKLASLIALIPVRLKAQDLEDEASTFTILFFGKDEEDESEDATERDTSQDTGHERRPDNNREDSGVARKRKRTDNPLSRQEVELQREFLVLCFLYELSRVREVVREVWMLYHRGALSLITAALVTDLVQSYIQQNVAALVEDLDSYDFELQLSLPEIVQQLYSKLSASNNPPIIQSTSPKESDRALRHLLCVNAIILFDIYVDHKPPTKDAPPDRKLSSVRFLQHCDAVRQGKVKLPIWDKFTEAMVLRTKTHDAYLPFGFQIVLDVHEITRDDYGRLFKDVTQHGFDIAHLIRTHIEYEDHMWEIGKKPDYMSSACDTKFSNVYLASMNALLNWIQELLKTDDQSGQEMDMTTGVFLTIHPTLAGLTMWNFNRTYNGFSIAKVKWFVTTLAHLYNAAIEVGGLSLVWRDLDYIITMHGSNRLFVGGAPEDPQDFLERYYMSTCVSSRVIAKDYKHGRGYLPLVSNEIQKKRGLAPHFLLEDAIVKYYGPDEKGERWLKRHAIFNSLHQLVKQDSFAGMNLVERAMDPKKRLELQNNFEAMATMIAPRRPKNRRKNPPRVSIPKFAQTDDTHVTLFYTMQLELNSHELHSHFDYLSFYRRAYDFILRVRGEVLFDDASQTARRGAIQEDQNPNNETLLAGLFRGLKINPKDRKVETTGEEVSTDVVPLDKLKHITRILEEVIREGGSVELDRAEMRCELNWDGLKAAYDSEKGKMHNSGPQGQSLTVRNGRQVSDAVLPITQEEPAESENLPPGHWAVGFDTDPEDVHRLKAPAKSGISSAPLSEPLVTLEEDDKDKGRVRAEGLSGFDDLLGEFDSELGSESESDKHIDTSGSKPSPSQAEALLRKVKDADAKVMLTANKFTNKPHQAYVSDVAEEDDDRSTTLYEERVIVSRQADVDDTTTQGEIQPKSAAHTTGITLELHGLQGQGTITTIHSKGPKACSIVEVRSCKQDHATNTITGLNVANIVEDEEDQGRQVQVPQENVSLVQKPQSELDPSASGVSTTDRSTSTDDLTGTSSRVSHYDELYDELPTYIPYLTRTRNLDQQSVRKPHRLTSSRLTSRKHTVTVTSTSGRSIFSRHSKGHRHCLIALARKQSLSLKSHVICSLGRALLDQKSRLLRRMHISTKVLLAKKVWTRRDLQVATSLISVSERSSTVGSVGNESWDSDSSLN